MRALSAFLIVMGGCAADPSPPGAVQPAPVAPSGGLLLRGARAPGGAPVELWLEGRHLADPAGAGPETEVRDLSGKFVAPAVIDGHTHLSYVNRYGGARCGAEACSAQEALRAKGVVAAVDLAAPLDDLPNRKGLRVAFSGPMLTAPRGYPTRSWGRDGFGLEVSTAEAAEAAVARLGQAGAKWIKLPLHGPPLLAPEAARAAVDAAHARGMRVAVHAPSAAAVEAAAALGADLLAHAPVERLPDHVAMAWAPRAVVGTLSTFSGVEAAQDNLRKLYEAGATILYGTDLGNGNRPEISAVELERMRRAGLPARAVVEAATSRAAEYFGFDELGHLAPGAAACVLVLASDPHVDPTALARPLEVIGEGCRAE